MATIDLPTLLQRVQLDGSGFSRGAQSIQADSGRLTKSFGGIKASVTLLAGSFAGLAAGKFLKDSIDAASDLNETISASEKIFGPVAREIEAFAETADTALGQSKQAAIDGANTFATFGKSAGLAGDDLVDFSTTLLGLSSDLASFKNTTPEEAILALGAALRGESEPIRRYGVLLDDASLRQEALRQGLISTTKDALNPQQRVLAAYQLILKQTADAQGDFKDTSDQLANSQRILAAQFQNLKAEVGQNLLPTVLGLVATLSSSLLPAISRTAEAVTPLAVALGQGLAATMPAVVAVIDALVAATRPLIGVITDVTPLITDLAAAAGEILAAALEAVTPLISALAAGASAAATGALPAFTAVLQGLLPTVESFGSIMIAIEPALTAVAEVVGTVVGALGPLGLAFAGAFQVVQQIGGRGGLLDGLGARLLYVGDAFRSIGPRIAGAVDSLLALNPVLLGIGIAAGVAAIAFIDWSKQRAAEKRQIEDFTNAMREDTLAIDENSGALHRNERALIAKELRDKGLADSLGNLNGLLQSGRRPFDVYTEAVFGNAAAQDELSRAIIKVGDAGLVTREGQRLSREEAERVIETWERQGGSLEDAAASLGHYGIALTTVSGKSSELVSALGDQQAAHTAATGKLADEREAGLLAADALGENADAAERSGTAALYLTTGAGAAADAMSSGADAGSGMATAVNEMGQATEEAIPLVDRFQQLIDELTGHALSMEEANVAWESAIDDLTTTLQENGNTLDIATEKGRANRQAIAESTEAALAQAQALVESGASAEEATGVLSLHAQQLLDTAAAAGLNAEEARKLTADLLGIPPEVASTITSNADLQRIVVETYNQRLSEIPATKDTTVTADTEQAQSNVQRLIDKFGTLERSVGRVGGLAGLTGRAGFTISTGGGPGGHTGTVVPGTKGRETSIRALGGEGIVTAATVEAIGRDLFGRQVMNRPATAETAAPTVIERHYHLTIEPKYATFDEQNLERTLERLERFG